jgi:DNA-binding NtrC family response regulator
MGAMSPDPEEVKTRVIPEGERLVIPTVDLAVLDGPDRGQRFTISQGVARIGTAAKNDLRLSDPTVSRLHAEIAVLKSAIAVRDAGSRNGTFIDGIRIESAHLPPGATLRIGNSSIRAEVRDEPTFVEVSPRTSLGAMIGKSVEMRRIYAMIDKVAPTDTTVLVEGETGTGKELVARALHEGSRRAEGPFVAIDCGAIPENLVESELFGHVRGAFSGATSDRAGAFDEAEGGTLFFDEVGELPLPLQKKLLRALEAREIRKVGGTAAKRIDVRVIAATNRSLSNSVNDGVFREDLFYRLAVVSILLPPLRMRRDDIPLLADHFIERLSGSGQKVPPALLPALVTRGWPGNVRELKNYIERWVVLEAGAGGEQRDAALPSFELPTGLELLVPVELPFKEARVAWTARFENVYVRALLAKTNGNITHAAERAGLNRRFLQRPTGSQVSDEADVPGVGARHPLHRRDDRHRVHRGLPRGRDRRWPRDPLLDPVVEEGGAGPKRYVFSSTCGRPRARGDPRDVLSRSVALRGGRGGGRRRPERPRGHTRQHEEHERAKGDPVEAEGGEAEALQVAEERRHHPDRHRERRREADRERPGPERGGHQLVTVLVEVVHGRDAERGDREEERELGRRRRAEPGELTADDRGHRARRARPEREALRHPDHERALRRHVGELGRGLRATPPERLDADHEGAADDERGGHGDRAEEARLDHLVEQEAHPGRGHEGDGERRRQPHAARLAAREAEEEIAQARPVIDDHREHGAELDHHVEGLVRLVDVTQIRAEQNQVPGGRNGQKLGEAFEDPEGYDVEEGHLG